MSIKADLEKFAVRLTRELDRSVSIASIKQLGAYALELIKKRVRAGYGATDSGQRQRLKPLSKNYRERRKRMTLSPFTTPGKSNLTRSGRLIGGLRVLSRGGLVRIEPTGRSREGEQNTKVAEFVSADRPFLNLTTDEERKLVKFYRDKILDQIKL